MGNNSAVLFIASSLVELNPVTEATFSVYKDNQKAQLDRLFENSFYNLFPSWDFGGQVFARSKLSGTVIKRWKSKISNGNIDTASNDFSASRHCCNKGSFHF